MMMVNILFWQRRILSFLGQWVSVNNAFWWDFAREYRIITCSASYLACRQVTAFLLSSSSCCRVSSRQLSSAMDAVHIFTCTYTSYYSLVSLHARINALHAYQTSPLKSKTHTTRPLSSSLHFNDHFPDGPGLAGTRMYPFWILLELRVMKVVITTAKLQSKFHHQQTNTNFFFIGRMPFLSPNQQCQSAEGMEIKHI